MAQTTSFALITGCSSGIGKALAVAFAAQGVTVLATARRVEYLKELTSEHENIEAFELELSSPESIAKLKDAVSERTDGRLDFLVNNAGTHYASTAMDLEIEEVEKVFQVNLFAVMRLCQIFIPLLRNSPRGRIVQLGSVTRNVPMVWQAPYNASKAALSQYSKTLRLEVKPFGIEVIELVTGFVQSNANGMPADAYARSVVAKLVKPQVSAEIWEGVHARTLRLLVTILPLRLFNWFFYRRFKLSLLESREGDKPKSS
ncbi:hypothetical protein AFLA_002408 [Aspergillus flavus NRRL3357]|nr:hypothetical protein AFLA_002408 [Aspergillus flavus NRRL3357]